MHTVVSLVPFPIEEQKPGLIPGKFVIAPSESEVPQILHVDNAFYYVYISDDRKPLKQISTSDQVARSIVEDYSNSQLGISDGIGPGIFFLEGQLSVEDVLSDHTNMLMDAAEMQKRWLIAICQIADNDWQRYHQHNVISKFQREAAEIIGWRHQEHPWMSPATIMTSTPCPACRLSATAGTIVCSNCKCILLPEEYKKLTFAF